MTKKTIANAKENQSKVWKNEWDVIKKNSVNHILNDFI